MCFLSCCDAREVAHDTHVHKDSPSYVKIFPASHVFKHLAPLLIIAGMAKPKYGGFLFLQRASLQCHFPVVVQ